MQPHPAPASQPVARALAPGGGATTGDPLSAMPDWLVAPRQGTVALTYGTFDLLHVGHVRLFRRIKARYDRLIVAVSTDDFNAAKGKRATVPFADRLQMVAACRDVDWALAEHRWEQKEHDICTYGVDAFVMGDDWAGHFDHLQSLCEVLYLPRTEGVSSTLLKQHVLSRPR